MNLPSHLRESAVIIYEYLAQTDPPSNLPSDAALGFGTFDLRLASFCGELHVSGQAGVIIFTGGIGAGTADLGEPEADAWWRELQRSFPNIDANKVVLENQSTNTAENISFTARKLKVGHPHLAFGRGIRSVVMVASPSRMRRAWLTLRQMEPSLTVSRQLPSSSLDEECALYESKGLPYLAHMVGELDRIVKYSDLGWLVSTELPEDVQAARRKLIESGCLGPG